MPQIKEYFHDVDLKANQLFNSRLHNITTTDRNGLALSLTAAHKGYQVYDVDLLTPFFWDGTQWNPAGGGTSSAVWGGITGTLTAQTDLTAYLAANYYPLSSNPAGYLTSAVTPTLQEVLDTDNQTNTDINFYAAASLHMNSGSITFSPDLINTGVLGSEMLTALRNWLLPNASGTIALTSDLSSYLTQTAADLLYYPLSSNPAGYLSAVPTLQEVTTQGFETTFPIVSFSTSGFQVKTLVNQVLASLQSNGGQTEGEIFIADTIGSPSTTYKRTEILVGTNTLSYPNASGTIALTSDIPPVGTWGALNYPTWVSGTPFVKMTAAGTFALDTTSYQPLLTNPVTGTGTATRVAFWDTSSSISSDSSLYWDSTNKRLGIGTASPAYKLDVNGEINTNVGIRLGTNGAQTGIYGGANIFDFWAGNNKIATWGLAPLGGTFYDHFGSPVYNSGDSGIINIFKIRGSVTSIGANTAGATQFDISPIYTQSTFGTGTLRGVYYHPQINSLNGSTHIAWENTSGDIVHGNLAGGGTQMVTVDNTGKLGTTSIPSGGVTSVGATGPITSSGGTTPTISTSMATNKLIGRSTAGTGVMEEITVGTGLSLSGGTLSATATGILHGTASGTDTYTATIGTASSYSDGDAFLVRFTNGNTGTATLNINGIGAATLYRNNDGVLLGGDIVAGGEMLCVYNSGTGGFQCIGVAPNTLIAYVTNDDSVTLTKGMPVYAFSGTGDRMTVKRALNTADSTSAQTVGLVYSASIAANQKGLIMIQGLLDGLSIVKPSDGWADGSPVYLGATAGTITNTKPYAPNHLVYLGVVTTASNGSAGRIYVRVQNGYELDELHNVQAQSPSLKDTLWYDSGVSPAQWKTASISTILGYTPMQRSVSSVSSNTAAGSATATDYVYLVSGTTTITLPTPSGNTNRYTIKNVGTNIVSIATTSGLIDGSTAPITINVQYVSLDLISDGANWNII